jgi:hypothetical protein
MYTVLLSFQHIVVVWFNGHHCNGSSPPPRLNPLTNPPDIRPAFHGIQPRYQLCRPASIRTASLEGASTQVRDDSVFDRQPRKPAPVRANARESLDCLDINRPCSGRVRLPGEGRRGALRTALRPDGNSHIVPSANLHFVATVKIL